MMLYVWDFHGVLEKDNEIALAEQINHILKKYGFDREITVAEALSLSGRHYRQVFFELCSGASIKQVNEMADYAVSTGMFFAKKHVKQREHAAEVLGEIQRRSDVNVVASNTSPENLMEYVKIVGLESCFDALLPVVCEDVDPASFSIQDYKFRKLQEYIANRKFDRIKCVGDKEWDIELGLKLGAETYLFAPNKPKPKTKASHVIFDLREVL